MTSTILLRRKDRIRMSGTHLRVLDCVRRAKGEKLSQLAMKAELSVWTLRRYRNGTRRMPPGTLDRLARALGFPDWPTAELAARVLEGTSSTRGGTP